MNLRNYGWLFGTTLLIGGLGGILSGLVVSFSTLTGSGVANLSMGLWINFLLGLTISIVAQMGFFAYMTVNYLALSFFKNKSLWKSVQVFLILFALFDMIYLRYSAFGQGGSILPFLFEPTLLALVAGITAYVKVKLTNPTALIPTLFFIFFVTALEWIPALKQDNTSTTILMILPLLFCNIWQIIHIQHLTKPKTA